MTCWSRHHHPCPAPQFAADTSLAQVWARIPKQAMAGSAAPQQMPQQMQQVPEPQLAADAAAPPVPPVTYTGYRLGQEEPDSDCEIVEDGGSEGGLPICPVCELPPLWFPLCRPSGCFMALHVNCTACAPGVH